MKCLITSSYNLISSTHADHEVPGDLLMLGHDLAAHLAGLDPLVAPLVPQTRGLAHPGDIQGELLP